MVLWLNPPLVPVIVRVNVPLWPDFITVTVSADVPAPDTDAGLKLALVREGSPLTLKPTDPLKPFTAPIVTVYEALPGRAIVCDAGDAEIVKSAGFAEVTTSVTVVLCVSVPSEPVIVSV